MQTWGRGGPWFFMQAQKGGSNNLVHVIKGGGGTNFYAKMLGSRSQSTIPLWSQSFFCKYNMEHILYLMTVEYKHGFLMTLLGLMSRSSPDSNKQYIVKIECKIYLFND